jgi:phage terminase large subunit-like protein
VLVEDASSGLALLQDLKNDAFYLVEAVKPKGDKVIRLSSVTPPQSRMGRCSCRQHALGSRITFTN